MKSKALVVFEKNIESVKILSGIYNYIITKSPTIEISEILRAEFVLLVSALDNYIHDIVREGMLSIFDGKRQEQNKFRNFKISLDVVKLMMEADEHERLRILNTELKKITSKDSYQSPSSIENALQLVSVNNIWHKIGTELSKDKSNLRKELGLIVHRRNKIAHEADIDMLTGEKNPINIVTIEETLLFIENIVAAIETINRLPTTIDMT